MKLVFTILLALSSAVMLGQSQTTSPSTPPAQTQSPGQQMPPDTAAPAPAHPSSADIQDELQKEFGRAPLLNSQQLKATVDDQTILLEGTVETQEQHDLALKLAQQYADTRKIADKITIHQKA